MRRLLLRIGLLAVLCGLAALWVLGASGGDDEARGVATRRGTERGAQPELHGVAAAPPPAPAQDPPPSSTAPPRAGGGPSEDGSVLSLDPEPGMGTLLLRLSDPRGQPVEIERWMVQGNLWTVPRGRVPRYPACAAAPLSVELRRGGAASRTRLPWHRLTLVAPAELPAEVEATVPDWDRDVSDPLRVLPVSAETGREIHGVRWEPPPDRPGVEPIHADARGVLSFPKALLESLAPPGGPPLSALFGGLMVPPELSISSAYVPTLSLEALGALLRGGELRVVLGASATAQPVSSLRVLGPEGQPLAGVRAQIGGRRERSDALGILRTPRLPDDAQATFYNREGHLWEHIHVDDLPAREEAGDATRPVEIRLPVLRPVGLHFPTCPREQELFLRIELGRLLPDGIWIWTSNGVYWSVQQSGGERLTRVLLPEGRPLSVVATLGDPWLPGSAKGGATFRVEPGDRRIVFDWPPTDVVSREAR